MSISAAQRILTVGLGLTLLTFAAACSGVAQAAQQTAPTLSPTETAVPLVTPTTAPSGSAITLPTVDWADVSIHRQAMKPEFASDVEEFVDANRYLIVAGVTLEPNGASNDAVIRGAERVRYTNHSSDRLDSLVFRLYPNSPALGGRMVVSNVTVDGQKVEPSLRALRSVMDVPLPEPLGPGQSAELTVDFSVVMSGGLNTSYGRFGFVNQVISATAWYPTLSVYEKGAGWWESLPSPQGDPAYTEVGLYDVRLTLPADMTPAMSGVIIETTPNDDGTVTYRDVTGPMRDHAFQASVRYMITPVEADGTRINLVHYRDRAALETDGTEDAGRYAVDSVKAFNAAFGQYPYAKLDVVMNPTPSGVEFPGLVQIAARSWVRGEPYLEIVIAHEIGHQWFYALVGNNQVEHPWLDESLTSFTEVVYLRYVDPTGRRAQEHIAGFDRDYSRFTGSRQADQALDRPVQSYTGFAYGAIVYRKGPLFIVELERQLGQDVVQRALATYFERFRYKVATSADFQAVFEEVSGKDLGAVFDEWVYNNR